MAKSTHKIKKQLVAKLQNEQREKPKALFPVLSMEFTDMLKEKPIKQEPSLGRVSLEQQQFLLREQRQCILTKQIVAVGNTMFLDTTITSKQRYFNCIY